MKQYQVIVLDLTSGKVLVNREFDNVTWASRIMSEHATVADQEPCHTVSRDVLDISASSALNPDEN